MALPDPTPVQVIHSGDLVVDLGRCRVRLGKKALNLTAAEFNLLAFLVSRPEEVLSRFEILEQVWPDQHAVSERAVDARVQRLRKKLGRAGRLIKTVRGAGYRFSPEQKLKRKGSRA